MLLIATVLLGIVLALLRGGSLRYLALLPFRSGGAIVASLVIQAAIYIPAVYGLVLIQQGAAAIYIGALMLALAGVARNWRLGPAVRVALVGLAMNTAVVVANGGHMPVNLAAMRSVQSETVVRAITDHRHFSNTRPADRASRLLAFSDVFPVPLPFGFGNVFSLGDALIAGGAAALAYGATRRPWRAATVASGPEDSEPSTAQLLATR